jgi:hypothetical protein
MGMRRRRIGRRIQQKARRRQDRMLLSPDVIAKDCDEPVQIELVHTFSTKTLKPRLPLPIINLQQPRSVTIGPV